MRQVFLSLAGILAGLALFSIGNGLLSVAIPSRAYHLNFSSLSLGFLIAFYYGGFLFGCFGTPYLVRRVGHIRCFASFAGLFCVVTISLSFGELPFVWWVLRFIAGFCIAGIYMIAEAWINEDSTNENRGKVVSIYRVVDLSSLMLGSLVVGFLPVETTLPLAVAAVLINLGIIPVAMTSSQGPSPVGNVKLNLLHVFTTSRIGSVVSLVVGLSSGSFWGLAPAFGLSLGFTPGQASLFMGMAILGGALSQLYVGALADKMDREHLVAAIAFCASLAGLAVSFASQLMMGATLLIVMSFVWGATSMPLYSLAIASANDRAKATEFLEISGGLLVFFSVGAILGPIMAAIFVDILGQKGLYLFIGLCHGVSALYVIYRRRFVLTPVDIDQRDDFVMMPKTTQGVFELDPRFHEPEVQEKSL